MTLFRNAVQPSGQTFKWYEFITVEHAFSSKSPYLDHRRRWLAATAPKQEKADC